MTTSPLRKELQTYRNSKNADLKLDGGFFYRRSVPSKSASYHGTYTDLYDNADDEHTIKGGMSPRYSQFDALLPSKPSFGSGKLSGLYFNVKVKNADYSNPTDGISNAGDGVGLKVFKIDTKISAEGGASDGSTMIVNEDILAYSTYFTASPPHENYNDIFDGVGEEKTTKVEQGQMVVQKDAYLSLDDAHKLGRVYGKKEDRLLGWPMKKSTYKEHFGEEFDGQDIVRINRRRRKGRYVPGKFGAAFLQGTTMYVTNESKTGLTGKQKHDTFKLGGDVTSKIKYIDRQVISPSASPYTVSRSDVVTTANTTLHSVKEAKTFNELSSSGGTKEVAWGRVGFSSEVTHEGGQSIKMHTFWPALSNQDGWRRTSIFYPADSSNDKTHQRQECYIVKKIPVPKRWQDQGVPSSATKFGSVVSTKINIKKLAGAESKHYRRDADTVTNAFISRDDDGNGATQPILKTAFTRGMAICFSEFPPGMDNNGVTKRGDDTFYTFIKEHHPNMEDRSARPNTVLDSGTKDFFGVFLANVDGAIEIFELGVPDTASPDFLTFVADKFTHKIGVSVIETPNSAGTTTPADKKASTEIDFTDKWLDFNFVIDPDSQGATLMICDADDGKCLKRITLNNSTRHQFSTADNLAGNFPQYMSIWNVNTCNPNSGIGAYDDNHGPFADLDEDKRFTWKGYADTGLSFESVFHSSAQNDTINPHTDATVGDNLVLSDRRNGDTGGHLEKYWALVAGSEFYVVTNAGAAESATNPVYGRLNSSLQYVSESKYGKVTFETQDVTIRKGDAILVEAARPIDGGIAPGTDAENIFYIDSIKMHNFIPEIENATVVNANRTAGKLRIPSTHKTFDLTYTDEDDYNGNEDEGPAQVDTWSYLSLGFNQEDDFEGSLKTFLLSGFNTNNPRNTTAILDDPDSDLSNIRVGYTAETATLGGHTGIKTFQNSDGTPDSSEVGIVVGDGPANDEFLHDGTLRFIDGFTQKGFFTLQFTERTSEGATSRENPYCSARVTKIIDIKNGIIEVDNEDIFRLDPDEEYIMYRDGQAYSTANYLDGLKLVQKDGDILTFNKTLALTNNGSTLLNQDNQGHIYIGPKRFWLIIALLNKSARNDNTYLPERSYSSIVGVSGTESAGATYNEYLFTDEKYYKYKRNMDPFANLESNDINLKIDYGFGAMSDDVQSDAGHCGMINVDTMRKTVDLNSSQIDGLRIDISGIVESLKPENDTLLPLLLTPLNADNESVIKIHAEETSNEFDKPYLLTEFEDELPEIDDFKVKPDMENPFFPRYSWSCGADDAWYGFLNIDSKSIPNQYHNAVIHVPMNDTETSDTFHEARHGFHTANVITTEKIQGLTNADNGVLANIEGLSGFCLEFDGNDDFVEINAAAGSDPTADCTKEMTVLIHMIPDAAADERYIVAQSHSSTNRKFHLNLNSSNQVQARVWWGTGDSDYTELTSSSIVPNDGETPTAVMLVVDTEIDSGNVKLYLNGNLEDLSGQTSSSGGANNWKAGQNINGGNSEIFIGNSSGSGSNGFDGKLEELVIYKKALYPFSGKETELLVTKPFVEIDDTGSTASLPITAKIFIKDYHNIRGTSAEQVATAPQVTYRKAAFRLDNT